MGQGPKVNSLIQFETTTQHLQDTEGGEEEEEEERGGGEEYEETTRMEGTAGKWGKVNEVSE